MCGRRRFEVGLSERRPRESPYGPVMMADGALSFFNAPLAERHGVPAPAAFPVVREPPREGPRERAPAAHPRQEVARQADRLKADGAGQAQGRHAPWRVG